MTCLYQTHKARLNQLEMLFFKYQTVHSHFIGFTKDSILIGQTTLNSDVIMLYDIHQVLELKSQKRQLQLKFLYQNIMQQS